MIKVKFKEWDCQVTFAHYGNKRIAIQLMDAETFEPIATASVNMPDEVLADDEICIKDYSENEGMLEALIAAGVVSKPLRFVGSGWVTIPVCNLLIDVHTAVLSGGES